MSDPKDTKTRSIPQWQLASPSGPSQPAEDKKDLEPQPMKSTRKDPSRASPRDQASKFLDDEQIRGASTERKISFLESKGLTNEEVHKLLGISGTQAGQKDGAVQAQLQAVDTQTTTPSEPKASSQPSTSAPPIITYPEFLLHSQKPPPLVTLPRLLTAFYITSSVAATAYAASKYLVTPMLDSLTSARHSFFSTALSDVNTLNEKLEAIVSKVPAGIERHQHVNDEDFDITSLTSEEASTFFHRSVATQTSPHRSRSGTGSTDSTTDIPASSPSVVHKQQVQLQELRSHLASLLEKPGNSLMEPPPSVSSLKDSVIELRKYLDGITFASFNGLPHSGAGGDRDEFSRVKAEIRGVKGVLLSAKMFPGTGGTYGR